jgi:hypothetical protein
MKIFMNINIPTIDHVPALLMNLSFGDEHIKIWSLNMIQIKNHFNRI